MGRYIFAILITCLFLSPIKADEETQITWDFNSLDGWCYEHQDDAPVSQCSVQDGLLNIYTRANSKDRQKMRTDGKIFTTGTYTWRTYISDIAAGEQTSIGSWLYNDDRHELDFEVGYGTAAARLQYGIKSDEMIAYMTSQANPYYQGAFAITKGWHDFSIKLEDRAGAYQATWYVDGEAKQVLQLQYGSTVPFYIFCSVENLSFIGDITPQHDNYGQFDYVSFDGITTQHVSGIQTSGAPKPQSSDKYDLLGRKTTSKKGLFIQNNKKIIKK